jgi:hypothetical protein
MPWPKIGDKVLDIPTNTVAVIKSTSTKRDDEGYVRYFLLDGVPLSPAYPNGWRHSGEVSISKRAIAARESA